MKKTFIVIFIISMIAVLCAGCQKSPEPVNIAVVAEVANNNPIFEGDIPELAALPSAQDSAYCVILPCSTPEVLISGMIPSFAGKGYTGTMLSRIQGAISAELDEKISAASPSCPEIDIAAGTSLALRSIRANHREQVEDYLLFYGSMISTSGEINMVETPVMRLDVESAVEALLPVLNWDMTGIHIVIYHCGDAAGEQPPLTNAEAETLKDFYRKLFLAAGAASVEFREDLPPAGSYNFDQPVSIMATQQETNRLVPIVIEADTAADEAPQYLGNGEVIVFPERCIAFQPDSSELADPDEALVSLSPVIDYMEQNPEFEILLCATTTSFGEKDSSIAFSQERAASVCSLLLEGGIPAERIHTVGCGWSSCLYIPDRDSNGQLDETIAPKNRAVQIVDYHSDAAAAILTSLCNE